MAMERCPKCGGGMVRRSSSWLTHWARLVSGSGKRYCASCGAKWHAGGFAPQGRSFFTPSEFVVVSSLLAGLGMIYVSDHVSPSAPAAEDKAGPRRSAGESFTSKEQAKEFYRSFLSKERRR